MPLQSMCGFRYSSDHAIDVFMGLSVRTHSGRRFDTVVLESLVAFRVECIAILVTGIFQMLYIIFYIIYPYFNTIRYSYILN